MPVKNRIAEMHDEIAAWRRDFHEHPELLYDTHRTAAIVADKLREFGCDEVVEGIGRTGVVGLIRGRSDYERPRRRHPRRHGRAADHGGDRPPLRLEDARPDARLRPRRAHGDAARRRQISRRDAQLRRRGGRDLPAGGGGRGGRQGDGRRRPDRPLPHPRDLRHAQFAQPAAGRFRNQARPVLRGDQHVHHHRRRTRGPCGAAACDGRPDAHRQPSRAGAAIDRVAQRRSFAFDRRLGHQLPHRDRRL